MKKRSIFKQIVISLLILIVVYVIAIVTFETIDEMINGEYVDEDYISPIVDLLSSLVSFLSVIFEYVLYKNNYSNFFLNNSKSLKSSIHTLEKKRDNLLVETKGIINCYLNNEKNIHIDIAKERISVINSVIALESFVESYPELKADTLVRQLLNQVADLENEISNIKQTYNNSVTEYNTVISAFPVNLRRKPRLKFYEED